MMNIHLEVVTACWVKQGPGPSCPAKPSPSPSLFFHIGYLPTSSIRSKSFLDRIPSSEVLKAAVPSAVWVVLFLIARMPRHLAAGIFLISLGRVIRGGWGWPELWSLEGWEAEEEDRLRETTWSSSALTCSTNWLDSACCFSMRALTDSRIGMPSLQVRAVEAARREFRDAKAD